LTAVSLVVPMVSSSGFSLMSIIYGVVSNLQLVAIMVLIDVEFPAKVIEIMTKFSWLNLHIIPPFEVTIGPQTYTIRKTLDVSQYSVARHTTPGSLFIGNFFAFVILIGCLLFVYFVSLGILIAVTSYKKKKSDNIETLTKIVEVLKVKGLFFFYIPIQIAYLGLCFSAPIHIRGGKEYLGSAANNTVYAFAILTLILFCIGYPTSILIFLKGIKRPREWFNDPAVLARYGFLWGEFREGYEYFAVVSLYRKLLFGIFVGFLTPYPFVQVLLLLIVNMFYLMILALVKPYKRLVQSTVEYSMAILFMVLYSCCFALIGASSFTDSEVQTTIFVFAMLIACVQLSGICYQFYLLIKKPDAKDNKKYQQTEGLELQDNPSSSSSFSLSSSQHGIDENDNEKGTRGMGSIVREMSNIMQ